MQRFSLVGTIAVIITLVLSLTWLGVELIGRSFVDDGNESFDVAGLDGDVEIVRDAYGIPYINARTSDDAWTAVGFAHAQDRLWQMDLTRRAAQGRLSEIFGRRTVGFDVLMRTVGFVRIAREIFARMPRRTMEALEAYSRGVNAYLHEQQGRLPFEFDALGYAPEPWTPMHSILVMRMLGWELNLSMWSELVNDEINSRVDSARFAQILPYYPTDAPTIIPGGQRPELQLQWIKDADTAGSVVPFPSDSSAGISHARRLSWLHSLARVMNEDRKVRNELGLEGPHIGSNAWALSAERSESRRPMLANDPHLPHSAPCRWYQTVITCGTSKLAGVTVPGIPFVISGQNGRVAWGVTAMMADQADFFVEILDSSTHRSSLYDGSWHPLKSLRDTIGVRDSASVPIVVRITKHGPIVSDVEPWLGKDRESVDGWGASRDTVVALKWCGALATNELTALQDINKSKDIRTFTAAARLGGVPGMSLIYADAGGSIAYVPAATIPNRLWTSLPRLGWDSRFDWNGEIPMDRLPSLINPASGFVAAANNKVSNSLPFVIGDLWEDPSRATRLHELLAEGSGMNITDFIQIQGDVVSPHMRYLVKFLMRAFPDSAIQGSAVRASISLLRTWDAGMRDGSPEAAIAAAWLQSVIEMTYSDEMGAGLFRRWTYLSLQPMRAIRHHVMIESRWFDDVRTPDRTETRDDVLRKALGIALESLHKRFETWDLHQWRFGALHRLTFKHPLSQNETIRGIVNIGPFEIGGSSGTINCGDWDFARPYDVRVGPTMRQIVDFGDSVALVRSVITSGSSGQPLNGYYSNQTVLWLSHGYVSLLRTPPAGANVSSTTRLERLVK